MVSGLKCREFNDAQPQLALRIPRPRPGEIGADGPLKLLLRQRRRVAQQAQTGLPARHDRLAAGGIAGSPGERLRDGVSDHDIGAQPLVRTGRPDRTGLP